jgi:integrase
MPTNTLNDAKCRAARAGAKAQKLFDGGGLHLWLSPKGAKVWRLAYRVDGTPKTISIGPYPEISLAEARARRDALRAELRDGVDPARQRKQSRAGLTLAEAVAQYWEGRLDVSDGYRATAMRGIELHLLPALGARPIASITRDDLLRELLRMDAAGLSVYVRRVRMWAGQVFDWAVELGIAQINPAALIRPQRAFRRVEAVPMAALSLAEVPDLMARLAMERDLQSVLACRLLALTWTRTGELRMMRWDEIEGGLWRIPAGRMKRRRDHLVPLSAPAMAILDQLRARCRGSAYVFPAEHRLDRPMSENAVLYLLHRLGYKGRMTGHGWRAVASTWANEAGYGRDAIERQLAHAPDDRIRALYNRAEYLPERRRMLEDWAVWLGRE